MDIKIIVISLIILIIVIALKIITKLKKETKRITAKDIHELALELNIEEYYNLFQLMFNNITKFIVTVENKVLNGTSEQKPKGIYKDIKK